MTTRPNPFEDILFAEAHSMSRRALIIPLIGLLEEVVDASGVRRYGLS